MLTEQSAAFWQRDTGVQREHLASLERTLDAPHAVIISGLRRAGKSTLLAQLAHRLGRDTFYYVDFEDERFIGFDAADANDLFATLVEIFGERPIFIIDEIQNVPGWERFVRRFTEMGIKFFITGSNASLLSQELGTRLTGRHIPVEVFPFSLSEFLRFQSHDMPDLDRPTTAESALLNGRLNDYIRLGGLPEALTYPELPIARTLYDDVLYRDVATRHRIGDIRALKELSFELMSHPSSLVSFNKMKGRLGLGSVNTVKSYVDHLKDSWLLFTTTVYDASVKRQQLAPKKVYAIDTGLSRTVGFSTSPDAGRRLENIVFLALRRATPDIHYYASRDGFEVDFFIPGERRLIQVTERLDQPATRERELRALSHAMRDLGLDRGLILTRTSEDPIAVDGGTIQVRSVVEWLLRS